MIDVYRTTPADLRRIALEKGRMGHVAASDGKTAGQLHYTKAAERGGRYINDLPGETRKTEDQLVNRLLTGLPAVRRRTHQERFRSMFNRLAETALDSYRRVGYVAWPASIEAELKALGWQSGDPQFKDYGGLDGVYKQVELLTRMYIEKGSNKQKERDSHKVTLDWHGHTAT